MWRDGHNPSLYTNQIITQIIFHSLYYILSDLCEGLDCVWSLWSDTIGITCNTENDKWFVWLICNTDNNEWFVWRDGLCVGTVCVKGYVIQRMIKGLCEVMVCVMGWFVGRTGLHIVWFVWRDNILSGLCHFTETRNIQPFTQTR